MACPFNYKWHYFNNTHHLSYDLCPLFLYHQSLKHEIIEETPPTQTRNIYDIALGTGLSKDGTLPANLQCPPASFICLTVVNTRPDHPSEPPRILQVVPVASGDIRPRFRSTNTTTGADLLETHLQLTVHGLLYMKQKQRAVFHMQCVESGDVSNAQLEFLYTWNGTHVFNWKTKYGCPRVTEISDGPKGGSESSDDPETNLPPKTDEDIRMPLGSTLSPWSFSLVLVFVLVVLRVIIPSKCQHRIRRLATYHRTRHGTCDILLGEITRESETQPLNDLVDGRYARYNTGL
ncbi:hypothetical protein Ac2012v2_007044 [Leucoagaricus gongylophorus]